MEKDKEANGLKVLTAKLPIGVVQTVLGLQTEYPDMKEFDQFANRNDLKETKDQLISRFEHGLRLSIRDQAPLQTLYSLNEVVTLAKKI